MTNPHLRLVEFSRLEPDEIARLPPAIINSIASFRFVPVAGAGDPLVVVAVRETKGEGCAKVGEVAGFYSKDLKGAAPIGEAAVKAILDDAAASRGCAELACPEECPCRYTPQAKLALYTNNGVIEEGYLLQGATVWNIRCAPKVEG